MSTPLTDRINSLTSQANSVTGASNTTLSDAVESLIAGYGGGESTVASGTVTIAEDAASLVLPSVSFEPKIIYVYVETMAGSSSYKTFRGIYTRDITEGISDYYNLITFERTTGASRTYIRTMTTIPKNTEISLPSRYASLPWIQGTYRYIIAG